MKPSARHNKLRHLLVQFQNQTKHGYPHQYAPSKEYLDWKNQPNPYRLFRGSDAKAVQRLFLSEEMVTNKACSLCGFDEIYKEQEVVRNHSTDRTFANGSELNAQNLSLFMFYSMSLSATKSYKNNNWSLRVNPSSGNLHPCEAYLILDSSSDVFGSLEAAQKSTSVYLYHPRNHGIQLRTQLPGIDFTKELLFETPSNHTNKRFFAVSITSVNYRETWKYGIRSFRYTQLDTGHAINAIRYSASLLGWDCIVMNDHPLVTDNLMEKVLGLDQFKGDYEKEKEVHEVILLIDTQPELQLSTNQLLVKNCPVLSSKDNASKQLLVKGVAEGKYKIDRFGTPNKLCSEHQDWPQMEIINDLCKVEKDENTALFRLASSYPRKPVMHVDQQKISLSPQQIIRQRRSAQSFDGLTCIETKEDFYSIMEKLLPSRYPSIWKCLSPFDSMFTMNGCNVHLILFVHRVKGLENGMYFLFRGNEDSDALKKIKADWNPSFEWKKVDDLPLYMLHPGDLRQFSKLASCIQDIAGDCCFSLAMVTPNFTERIDQKGGQAFKELYQEAGFIGHILYLEAERLNLRATGIGCYFDDTIHENTLLELPDDDYDDPFQNYQDLYHFTVGKPVEDKRIRNISPYEENLDKFND